MRQSGVNSWISAAPAREIATMSSSSRHDRQLIEGRQAQTGRDQHVAATQHRHGLDRLAARAADGAQRLPVREPPAQLRDVTLVLAHQLAVRHGRVEHRHRRARHRHLHVQERAAVRPQRAPDRQHQHDADEVAGHRVQPGAQRRLVQAKAREHRRAAVEDDVALQHREADHDVGRRAGRDHQRAVDTDEPGRQGQQRRRHRQVREQQARQHGRDLPIDDAIEDPARVALQIGVHAVRGGAARGGVHDLDALVEASGLQPDGVGADAGRLGTQLLLAAPRLPRPRRRRCRGARCSPAVAAATECCRR